MELLTSDTVRYLLAAAAIATDLIFFPEYFRQIFRGNVRPHAFSWLVWMTTSGVAFAAQLASDAGIAAFVLGEITLLCAGVFLVALRHGERRGTRIDWMFLIAAASAIPLWQLTDDPLWAVILVTAIDLCGYGPTFRKGWVLPHEESITIWLAALLKYALALAALETFSIVNVLYPLVGGVLASGALVVMLVVRRASATPENAAKRAA